MAVNKVVRGDGVTLIDLSTDTVTSADHIMAGYIGHLADGTVVTGTGSGGGASTTIVVPEQTLTISQPYTEIPIYTEDLVAGERYIYTVNGASRTVTAESLYGSPAVVPIQPNVAFDQSSSQLYFSVSDSSLYGEYTIKLEKVVSGGSSTLIEKTITANGTYTAADDGATGYSSVTVNVPTPSFATYYTGSTDPSSSVGSNGDIYLKVVS